MMRVLEWSKKQNAFHVQDLSLCVEKNLNALLENRGSDYIPIYVGTDEECRLVANRWRGRLMARESAA